MGMVAEKIVPGFKSLFSTEDRHITTQELKKISQLAAESNNFITKLEGSLETKSRAKKSSFLNNYNAKNTETSNQKNNEKTDNKEKESKEIEER